MLGLVVGSLSFQIFHMGQGGHRGPSEQNFEMMMAFRQYWEAYQEAGRLISSAGRSVPNSYYRLRIRAGLSMGMVKEVLDDCRAMENGKVSGDDMKYIIEARFKIYIMSGDFKQGREVARKAGDTSAMKSVDSLEGSWQQAQALTAASKWDEALPLIENVMRECSVFRDAQVLMMDCSFMRKDFQTYLQYFEKLQPTDEDAVYRVAVINFCRGHGDKAIGDLKGHRAANSSAAFKLFQDFEKKRKEVQAKKANTLAGLEAMKHTATAYCPGGSHAFQIIGNLELQYARATKGDEEFMAWLDGELDTSPQHHEARMERAELLMKMKDYSRAQADFSFVARSTNSQKAHEGARRAEEAERAQNYVDYYAILGVDKRATTQQIQEAYRTKLRYWHPDRWPGKEEKKRAEEEMKRCNQARDILGDQQKRRAYDAGQDPDQANMHMGWSGGDFFGGGFPFGDFFGGGGGGGGGNFRRFEFHF